MSGRLTTHVLDIAHGRPAEGMEIELWSHRPQGAIFLKAVHTNADGRVDEPLLTGSEMTAGEYELIFHVGDYFTRHGGAPGGTRFLDRVPVRFRIADADAHYHVPLLVSPWSYTTYRGS